MKKTRLALWAFVFMMLLFPLAGAHAFNEGACAEDAGKYCKGVPAAGGKLKECMIKHRSELSNACKANLLDVLVKEREQKNK